MRASRPSAGDRVRGAFAAIVVLALVAGIPAALLGLLGSPVPQSAPSGDALLGALTRPDDGTLLLGLLEVVAWSAWALFTASVGVEILGRARHFQPPSFGPQQAVAASLVASAALLFAPLGHAPAHAAQGDAPRSGSAITAEAPVVAPAPIAVPDGFRAHVVRPGEHLWQIAEEELGDGDRHVEIFEATRGIEQPDGRRLERADLIRPGWTVLIPAGQPAAVPEDRRHVVRAGDTLWSIAAEQLGDGHQYPRIAALNGIADPARITTGQSLRIPGPQAPAARTVAVPPAAPVEPASPALDLRTPLGSGDAPVPPAPATVPVPAAAEVPVELDLTTPLGAARTS